MPDTDDQLDRDIAEAARALAQQEALVHTMVVRGAPSQAAEDRLRSLERKLASLKERRGNTV